MRQVVDSQQGISPLFLLRSLHHWWMVAAPIGLVLAVVGAGVVWWVFEPIYVAQALLRIRDTPVALLSPTESSSKAYVETQMGLIRSAPVLRAVVHSGDIRVLPELRDKPDPQAWLRKEIRLVADKSELASPNARHRPESSRWPAADRRW